MATKLCVIGFPTNVNMCIKSFISKRSMIVKCDESVYDHYDQVGNTTGLGTRTILNSYSIYLDQEKDILK